MAVRKNSLEMAQRLVDHGASPDAQTKWGEAPAHTAARLGFLEMLKFLQYCDANLHISSPVSHQIFHHIFMFIMAVCSILINLISNLCTWQFKIEGKIVKYMYVKVFQN